ncbi:hypothetical protein D4764_06G0005520, partial [Takifugu flavidus]
MKPHPVILQDLPPLHLSMFVLKGCVLVRRSCRRRWSGASDGLVCRSWPALFSRSFGLFCCSFSEMWEKKANVAGDLREELEVDSRRTYARPSYWARMIGGPPSAFGTNREASPSTPRFVDVDSGPIRGPGCLHSARKCRLRANREPGPPPVYSLNNALPGPSLVWWLPV